MTNEARLEERGRCGVCLGSGICQDCSGDGEDGNTGNEGPCEACDGRGVCLECDGGRVYWLVMGADASRLQLDEIRAFRRDDTRPDWFPYRA